MAEIQKILFKRGYKAALEENLVEENCPAEGEPIFELGTGKIKIGQKDIEGNLIPYKDLPYVTDFDTIDGGDASDWE